MVRISRRRELRNNAVCEEEDARDDDRAARYQQIRSEESIRIGDASISQLICPVVS